MDGMLYDMATGPADLYRVTREDYLAGELQADFRSEWVNGVVYNMGGATKVHVATVSRIIRLLFDNAEALSCLIGSSDLLVETADAIYYPDVVVSCDFDHDARIELNPCFIAEVLSLSTKRVDKHEKRHAYCELPSLRDYWIVDADAKVIEVWTRNADGWFGEHRSAGQPIRVQCLDLDLRVVDIVGV
jgi:Uma2 family endonuclease